MYPEIVNKSETLIKVIDKKLKTETTVELKDVANRFTVDIISSVAFGMEANTLNGEHNELQTIFKEIFPASGSWQMILFFVILSFPKLAKKLRLKLMSKTVSNFFMGVVGNNIKNREEKNDNRKDFLNMLIQLKNRGSIEGEISSDVKKLTLNEILAQAFLFFFAGADTSSTTISFALMELARNEKIQERLRKEIEEKTKETNGKITYEALHEMKYLAQVVDGEKF